MLPVLLFTRVGISNSVRGEKRRKVPIDDGTSHRRWYLHEYPQVPYLLLQVASVSSTEAFGKRK
jgi:hypothetical protein